MKTLKSTGACGKQPEIKDADRNKEGEKERRRRRKINTNEQKKEWNEEGQKCVYKVHEKGQN